MAWVIKNCDHKRRIETVNREIAGEIEIQWKASRFDVLFLFILPFSALYRNVRLFYLFAYAPNFRTDYQTGKLKHTHILAVNTL